MSAPVDAPKPVEVPQVGTAGTVEPAPAPVIASDAPVAVPADAPVTDEAPKVEGEAVAAPAEEVVEAKEEDKVVAPIESGALGYKAPGLKNAFRFAKKYFWFGEEPVPAENLREYLRGEKPEVAHSVAAWSSQTGKGLLFFVKHADQKEHPAGVLNLAYATDLAKDGAMAFAFKISGHKHTFEAQTTAERDGWFVAVERAITEAKASKDGIETSDSYKEAKEKISKPAALAGATSSAPKKSMDAAPKLAEADAPVAGESAAVPARTGSSSSSSSDEAKAKKAKNKSRSVSRGKRASLFGGLLGKKDKEHKDESEVVKEDAEAKKEDGTTAPQLDEVPTSAPVNANDVVKPAEETTEPTAAVAVPTEEAAKVEETPAPVVAQEKPKPTKRASIFGNFVEKLKSPTTEKKESEAALAPATVKETETAEASKPLEEAEVAVPVAPESAATETTEAKPVAAQSRKAHNGTTFMLNTGAQIPALGFGTWQDKEAQEPAVLTALKLGYRHIDTARIYGTEPAVGSAIHKSGVPRSKLFLTTKLWNNSHHPSDVAPALEASLKDLGTDYVDLYLMHWPSPFARGDSMFPKDSAGKTQVGDTDYVATYHAMEKLLESGKVRAIGVSNFSKSEMERLIKETSVVPAVHQLECHPYLQQTAFTAWHKEQGIHVTQYSPFGNQNTIYDSGKNMPKLIEDPVLVDIGKKYGKSGAQVALAWGISLGRSVIPKSKTEGRIKENLEADGFVLEKEDLERVAEVDKKMRFNDPSGNFGWDFYKDLEGKK
ncbi:aldehyde reductase [Pyrenophora seminiperda CCB06]|uniref:Aldehyde reductase n=1 Tax=Pyrenophora seminiperda CCB06 TaxID=1302712 RepID=A0A3M7M2Y3_9PLEO|nr:aldehyde reductase [Pyrenophora seminiperda CCB06]